MIRTHTCGDLRESHIGQKVALAGWVQGTRDHGGLVFVDLRDRYGITQAVFDPDEGRQAHHAAGLLKRECCVRVEGVVAARPEERLNPGIETGGIEVRGHEVKVLGSSATPPFEITDRTDAGLDIRLANRVLDLRRPVMQRRLKARSLAAMAVRNFLHGAGFLEVETPTLVSSTPEGARDFVVPSRIHKGRFYALPQSPQIYKQLLMLAGCDRYFQLARCLRDEDLRQDRQFEFTQIDLEMSFVDQLDVQDVTEELVATLVAEITGRTVERPFERISYDDSLARFGSDKPDLRIGLEISDVSESMKLSQFRMVRDAVEAGARAKAIVAPPGLSKGYLNQLIDFAVAAGAGGLAWLRVSKDRSALEGNLAKYFEAGLQERLIEQLQAPAGSHVLIVADSEQVTNDVLPRVREKLADDFGLRDTDALKFLWVIDFPLFEGRDADGLLIPSHHPFTSPREEDIALLEHQPERARAGAYDLVLNGVELGSGSVRISDPRLQRQTFRLLGLTEEQIEAQYGFFLRALEFGAPPHAGIALGFDRLLALLLGEQDIREVIAFPKSKSGESPVDGSPKPLRPAHLQELGIRLTRRSTSSRKGPSS